MAKHPKRPASRALSLAGVAVLFLATGALQSLQAEEETGWFPDCRRDRIYKTFPKEVDFDTFHTTEQKDGRITVVLGRKEFDEIVKLRNEFKKCDLFYKCLDDREKGKVKHCYENDRRWR